MIITKTPLRISFYGGGSDLPDYYMKRPGLVISTAINRYIQIAANYCQTSHCRVVYSDMEVKTHASEIQHDRVRETLLHFNKTNNIEICSFSDITTRGSGLGSSSTFTVGLVNALYNLAYLPYNKRDLAELACKIEIELCKAPIGKQDQYAAAYGGFNAIRFDSTGVEVTPIGLDFDTLQTLNENLMCYSTGLTRSADDILSKQTENLKNESTVNDTNVLVDIAEQALIYLKSKKIDSFGSLLHSSWEQKKKLAQGITNDHIDEMYETACRAGALGGKLLGAGGGGYLLFYVPKNKREYVSNAMKYYRAFHFSFCDQGSSWVRV